MTTKRAKPAKTLEDMPRTADGDVVAHEDIVAELTEASGDPSQEASRRAFLALAKLRELHRGEYDFYVEHAKKHPVEKWEELPDFPIRLTCFPLADYLKAALAIAEYEQDNGMIVASVPGDGGFFTQGENYEEARTNLIDAIEGNIQIALQLGWDIPDIPGFEIQYTIVPNNTP